MSSAITPQPAGELARQADCGRRGAGGEQGAGWRLGGNSGSRGVALMLSVKPVGYMTGLLLLVLTISCLVFWYVPAYEYHFERFTADQIILSQYDVSPPISVYVAAALTLLMVVVLGIPAALAAFVILGLGWAQFSRIERGMLILAPLMLWTVIRGAPAPVSAFITWVAD